MEISRITNADFTKIAKSLVGNDSHKVPYASNFKTTKTGVAQPCGNL